MKKFHNSNSFITNHQSKYSEEMFNNSISRVRNRINILSTSSTYKPQHSSDIQTPNHGKSHTLAANITKVMFDSQSLQQDIKQQSLQLKKTKQIIRILAQQIRKKTYQTQSFMHQKIHNLSILVDEIKDNHLKHNRQLQFEIQQRKRQSNKIKQVLKDVKRRIAEMQLNLGCYTASEKFVIL